MALQLSVTNQTWSSTATQITSQDPSSRSSMTPRRGELWVNHAKLAAGGKLMKERGVHRVIVRNQANAASLDTVLSEPETLLGKVTEVNKDTFWPIVEAAGDKPVILDMYTQWCGPCKLIAPKVEALAAKYLDVIFLKLDCNEANRPLAKDLKIKVVPTFKILKGGTIVKEVTGAKYDALVAEIEAARSS